VNRATEGQIVEKRAGGVPVRHDRLTALEAVLLRALYSAGCNWATDTISDVVGWLKDEGFDDGDCAVLEQLLEEEEADRQ